MKKNLARTDGKTPAKKKKKKAKRKVPPVLDVAHLPYTLKEIGDFVRVLDHIDAGGLIKTVAGSTSWTANRWSKELSIVKIMLGVDDIFEWVAGKRQLNAPAKNFRQALASIHLAAKNALEPKRFGAIELRIGSIPSVVTSFFPHVLESLTAARFFQKHPTAEIRTVSGSAFELFNRLDNGTLDLVISYPLPQRSRRGPKRKDQQEYSTRGWQLIEMHLGKWPEPSRFHEFRALFRALPVGLVFHRSNQAMARFFENPSEFSFQTLASMIVLLTSDPTQPALETEVLKCLPDPEDGVGTRVHRQTFNDIRNDLKYGGTDVQQKAVGIGVDLDGESGDILFLDFERVADSWKNMNHADHAKIRHLAEIGRQSFSLYRRFKKADTNPADPLDMLIRCIHRAVDVKKDKPYIHKYV